MRGAMRVLRGSIYITRSARLLIPWRDILYRAFAADMLASLSVTVWCGVCMRVVPYSGVGDTARVRTGIKISRACVPCAEVLVCVCRFTTRIYISNNAHNRKRNGDHPHKHTLRHTQTASRPCGLQRQYDAKYDASTVMPTTRKTPMMVAEEDPLPNLAFASP